MDQYSNFRRKDFSKQLREVILSWKVNKQQLPSVFNTSNVTQINCQKHLGMILDSRLTFNEYLEGISGKVNRRISIIRKLQPVLVSLRSDLQIIHRSFVRPHVDYGDVTYDQAYN